VSNPAVYDNRSRDGLSSIQKIARQACSVANWAAPIIRLKYRATPAILALLEAVEALCVLLPDADAALLGMGDNSDPLEDPTGIPGVDPGAAAPPAPPA